MGHKINVNSYIKFLASVYPNFSEDGRMSKDIFEKWVGDYFGTDPRTIEKHTRRMLWYGLIENDPVHVFTIYRVALPVWNKLKEGIVV